MLLNVLQHWDYWQNCNFLIIIQFTVSLHTENELNRDLQHRIPFDIPSYYKLIIGTIGYALAYCKFGYQKLFSLREVTFGNAKNIKFLGSQIQIQFLHYN